jgi:steroid 5-alpha reductase family enzyme
MSLLIIFCAIAIFIYMTANFVVALWRQRTDIADIAWGFGFILVAIICLLSQDSFTTRMLIISALILIWGLRLSLYLFFRNRGKGEDQRYQLWRLEWGENFVPKAFLEVFLLRGLFMFLMAAPLFLVSVYDNNTLDYIDMIGIAVWLLGFILEAVSDGQLSMFTKRFGEDKILKTGLWKYSRHPNYFGESLQWWGIFLLAISVNFGYLAVVSPIIITIMVALVSGIPVVEKQYRDNSEYQEYKKKTNAFWPWFPRS